MTIDKKRQTIGKGRLIINKENLSQKAVKNSCLILLVLALLALFSCVAFADNEDYDCDIGKHKFIITVTEPTATTAGAKEYVCELCGYSYTQIIYATEHKWSDWIVSKQPTCTESGEQYRVCSAGGIPHQEYRSSPPLSHNYTVTTKNPTCTESGLKTYICLRCGNTYSVPLGGALGHSYEDEITTPPTCAEEGVRTFTCIRCGNSYTEAIARLTEDGHQYRIESETKADCQKNGRITYVCSVCGDSYEITLPATGHDYGEWIETKAPGLFTAGQRTATCKNNPEHILTESIPQHITLTLNVVDAVMAPTNTSLLLFFVLTLLADLYVIFWDLRMRSKSTKVKKMKHRYILTAYGLVAFIVGVPMILKLYIQEITYMNLLQITAFSSIIFIGLLLRLNSHRKRVALNGSGTIYEQGNQKGQLVSQNRYR